MISERQQTAILARTFFSRMFESDLMPPGLPQVQLLISLFAFFAAPSLILPLVLAKQYMFPPSVEISRPRISSDDLVRLCVGKGRLDDLVSVAGLLTSPCREGSAEAVHGGAVIADATQTLQHSHIGQPFGPCAAEEMWISSVARK